jgi:hypothetical protein
VAQPPLLLKASESIKHRRPDQAGRRLSHAEDLRGAKIQRVTNRRKLALNNALKPTACRVGGGGKVGASSGRQAAAYLGR